jgi:hypothetical protein
MTLPPQREPDPFPPDPGPLPDSPDPTSPVPAPGSPDPTFPGPSPVPDPGPRPSGPDPTRDLYGRPSVHNLRNVQPKCNVSCRPRVCLPLNARWAQ